MMMKFKKFLGLWVSITILLSVTLSSSYLIYANEKEKNAWKNMNIDKYVYGLPNVNEHKKEVEVVKEIENVIYTFPFKTSERKSVKTVGVCSDCLPQKVYPRMSNDGNYSVFASSSFISEGKLLWVDGVGIRQVQPLVTNDDRIYIVFNSHSEAINYGEKVVDFCEILE